MSVSRRNFLRTAGCITIGFPMLSGCWQGEQTVSAKAIAGEELPRSLQDAPHIDAWLHVLEDGSVQIFTGKMELGQGIRTAMAQVAADELDMDIAQVAVYLADTERTPDEGYTAGSGSMEYSAMAIRYAAAAAREKLLALAAQKLDTPADKLTLADGKISTAGGRTALSFAELLEGKQLADEVRMPVKLKPKEKYRWVGKAVPRKDIEHMVRAEPVYVQDLRFPNMVHARVVFPKAYQARLRPFDEVAVRQQLPDVLKLVVNGSFLGVIAEDEFQAMQARLWLQQNIQWDTDESLPEGKPLMEYFKELPVETQNVADKGDHRATGDLIRASYFKPYLMHGSIGPSCAVALYDHNRLHVWTHSQGVYPLREALRKMLDMPADQIRVEGVPGSGCYGHNGADDVAADAALLAMAYPGRHVRLQWEREDEHGWEPYGCAMVMETAASLDNNGRIKTWQYHLWSDTHSARPGGDPGNLLVARYLEKPFPQSTSSYSGGTYRNSEPYYDIPSLKIDVHFLKGPLRVSSLRSLGAYGNVFAIESFMDELAHQAKKDPLAFRLMHSSDSRAIAVIKKLQDMTSNQQPAAQEGIGYAFSRYKNTAAYCAVAARVVADPRSGNIQVQQMWAVIDAGETINLDGLINQTEGGMIQAASWTLLEEVKYDKTHVNTLNWGSYPIFRFSNVPLVEVAVINQPDATPLGAGEAAQGPAGAAIANAVYSACGKRIRQLPISPEKIREA